VGPEAKEYLLTSTGSKPEDIMQNNTLLRYTNNPSSCVVTAKGSVDFVSEIGEQLAWLASTLRSSPISTGVLACTPSLSRLRIHDEDKNVLSVAMAASCRISFDMAVAQDIITHSPGFCWANLFRNPLLVTGYPIRRRANADTGLELSLSMMAALVQSRQMTDFGERLVLKGFCSLLVATAAVADAVVWHLLFNPIGERISYCDSRLENIDYGMAQGLMLRDLESRRHIVGWCSEIKDYPGKGDCN
jgi:hypothetical protein